MQRDWLSRPGSTDTVASARSDGQRPGVAGLCAGYWLALCTVGDRTTAEGDDDAQRCAET
ncbi:BZ3500_MvSof-1268-A1-R1_Chr4-1g06800 [Microbotryum saponariae]|uniref:BZ3500_MvSof-1268-A1-R1_Chr4-1g06800 protein n=1 Tax=Microbotryum saponariae TaxID=289078 RepID=A0A2X0NLD5_9BASI|nr:BZ3500_MvSof-1268-A1-R1_Chr4-1g06800 [Microbotryum saponariae]SDA06457.1 BZ3501_MvSof-1269-A2-R1_Chr4-1g06502 [Microbotryum saponariae]